MVNLMTETPKKNKRGEFVFATNKCQHDGQDKGEFCDFCLIASGRHFPESEFVPAKSHVSEGTRFHCNHCS